MRASERRFSRKHVIEAEGLDSIEASAARVFHGDADRWNPELLLISAVAECHMMTFLFLAKREGLEIVDYQCRAEGTLSIDPDGVGGEFAEIALFPVVSFRDRAEAGTGDEATIIGLHTEVEKYCFIARSVKAPITVHPSQRAVAE
ncbi:OsmC family protein [Leucobacter sp. UCMA 4100]|uniref:OsmC family protein n=1 Tax=Leucobacter sp. UCMA 4100 TaxID=2810534 RepID=UPI0022EA2FE3|nr:OsmC family protein [Leucobacter sp. UCMA 4100]MDA3145828.1 OsmC family protein [Leucobacter sp. UCMA 4100]